MNAFLKGEKPWEEDEICSFSREISCFMLNNSVDKNSIAKIKNFLLCICILSNYFEAEASFFLKQKYLYRCFQNTVKIILVETS